MLVHKAITRLVKAASKDGNRYQLNGVFVRRKGSRAEACATSGNMLAKLSHPIPDDELPSKMPAEDGDEVDGVIIPIRYIEKLRKVIGKATFRPILQFLRIRSDKDTADIQTETVDDDLEITSLSGKAIEGSYPNYEAVCNAWGDRDIAKLNPFILFDAVRLLLDLVKDLGIEGDTGCIQLSIPTSRSTADEVDKPIGLHFRSPEGVEVDIYVMPIVKV